MRGDNKKRSLALYFTNSWLVWKRRHESVSRTYLHPPDTYGKNIRQQLQPIRFNSSIWKNKGMSHQQYRYVEPLLLRWAEAPLPPKVVSIVWRLRIGKIVTWTPTVSVEEGGETNTSNSRTKHAILNAWRTFLLWRRKVTMPLCGDDLSQHAE